MNKYVLKAIQISSVVFLACLATSASATASSCKHCCVPDQRKVEYQLVQGSDMEQYVNDMIRLRLTVFRESPYFYDGTEGEERAYLEQHLHSEKGLFLIAKTGDHVIGMLSGTPMKDRDDYAYPYVKNAIPTDSIFCLGELVVEQSDHREQIGLNLYQLFEEHVRSLGSYDTISECVVLHPIAGEGKSILMQVGGSKCPNLVYHCFWKEIDQEVSTDHVMEYWSKQL